MPNSYSFLPTVTRSRERAMPKWKLDTDNFAVVADGDASDAYDPADYSVADVKAYVEGHPDEREAILAAEQAGKARVTLVEWLSGV